MVKFSDNWYSYIPESRRRIDVLREAAKHLRGGVHILLSYSTAPRPHRLATRLARAAGTLSRSDWRAQPGDFIRREDSFYYYHHAFRSEEIAAEVAGAGLRVVYRREPPNVPVMVLTAY